MVSICKKNNKISYKNILHRQKETIALGTWIVYFSRQREVREKYWIAKLSMHLLYFYFTKGYKRLALPPIVFASTLEKIDACIKQLSPACLALYSKHFDRSIKYYRI